MMKKIICVSVLVLLVCTTTVFAEGADLPGRNDGNQVVVDVEYVGNGNYIEIVIFDDKFADASLIRGITPLASKTVTKTKLYNCKNAEGKVMWYVKVTGTFTYGNGSAKCTASNPSAAAKDSSWKVSKATGSRSGNWCSATATGKHYGKNGKVDQTLTRTVKLTCSPTGVFS